jgi:hypothetical protein
MTKSVLFLLLIISFLSTLSTDFIRTSLLPHLYIYLMSGLLNNAARRFHVTYACLRAILLTIHQFSGFILHRSLSLPLPLWSLLALPKKSCYHLTSETLEEVAGMVAVSWDARAQGFNN